MRTFLGALLPLLGGCFLSGLTSPVLGNATSEWFEVNPVMKPLPQVMETVRETVRHAGFALLPEDGTSRVYTEWLVQLSMHWRQGYRTKVEVEVSPLEPRGLRVRVRGIREVNDNLRNSSKLEEAQWINASFEETQKNRIGEYAMRVHQILKFKLLEN